MPESRPRRYQVTVSSHEDEKPKGEELSPEPDQTMIDMEMVGPHPDLKETEKVLDLLFEALEALRSDTRSSIDIANYADPLAQKLLLADRFARIVEPVVEHIETDECTNCLKEIRRIILSSDQLEVFDVHLPVSALLARLEVACDELKFDEADDEDGLRST